MSREFPEKHAPSAVAWYPTRRRKVVHMRVWSGAKATGAVSTTMTNRKLSLLVAVCNNYGIGAKGQLPWKLKGDMAFFKRITTETEDEDKQNVVLMGRRTWESIPQKFRPLPNRINVVLSTTLSGASLPTGVHLIQNFNDIFLLVETFPKAASDIFVIGGSSLYKMAMSSGCCNRVFLTSVHADFDCDTFFPEAEEVCKTYQIMPHAAVDSEEKIENGIPYKIELYEKCPLVPFSLCAAMLDNRGIGLKGRIAWPSIRKDFDHYMSLTSDVTCSGKKVVNIKGRITWDETCEEEKSRPSVLNIVVSHTLKECPQHVHCITRSFAEAHAVASQLYHKGEIERIWILGGEKIFQEAVDSSFCERIYLTQIFATYPSDAAFPVFEDNFRQIRVPGIEDGIQTEAEHKFEFKVFERC